MVLGVASTWALDRAPRAHSAAALAVCVVLGLALGSFGVGHAEFDVDRWAVRETGKFLRRNLDAGSTVAAPEAARSRLTYYATRPIAPLDSHATELDGLDYVVLDRRTMEGAPASAEVDDWPPRELSFHGRRLHVIAEFGSWILARVEPA
jgi:hypothetical protein